MIVPGSSIHVSTHIDSLKLANGFSYGHFAQLLISSPLPGIAPFSFLQLFIHTVKFEDT